jgi:hypothetical protein
MKCNEAAEFVSALCDGERIPAATATHIGGCPECQLRLNDYVRMGIELKRIASINTAEAAPEVVWGKQRWFPLNWGQIGRQTMRIPRVVFAMLMMLITVLAAGLVLARTGNTKSYVEFKIRDQDGTVEYLMTLSELRGKASGVRGWQDMRDGNLGYIIREIESKEGAEKLGIRALKFPLGAEQHSALEQVSKAPEQVQWYVPGQEVHIPVAGYESSEITVQLATKLPEAFDPAKRPFLPEAGELRLMSPALLRESKLVGDGNNMSATASAEASVAWFHVPGEGLFLFSLDKFEGAIAGQLENSRVEFRSEGQSYLLLTGAPLVGGDQGHRTIWVAHVSKPKITLNGKELENRGIGAMRTSDVPGFFGK